MPSFIVPASETVTAFSTESNAFDISGAQASKEQLNNAGYTSLDEQSTSYYYLYFEYTQGTKRKKVALQYAILIEVTPNGADAPVKAPNYSSLQEQIARVSDDKQDDWYTSDDRWNGISYSKAGFWADLTKEGGPLDDAEKALKALRQEDVDKACSKLETAIDTTLIPATRANTTLLYEELLNEPNKADYTPKSWAAYTKVRDRAEAMMSAMFDEKGNPTDANTSANGKQGELEVLAKELTAARGALDKRASLISTDASKRAELAIAAIQQINQQYGSGADLSAYTDTSVATLKTKLEKAVKLTKDVPAYSSIGSKELTSLQDALRELRWAVLGLETVSNKPIQVKLSVLDTSDIYLGHVGDSQANHNYNTRTAILTLDANASAYDLLHNGKYDTGKNTDSVELVFLNGELLYNVSFGSDYLDGETMLQSVKLHDNDELSVVWFMPNRFPNSSTDGTYEQQMLEIVDWFRYSTIQVAQEVTAGVPFPVTVTSESAFAFRKDGEKPFAGAEIYYGAPSETAQDAETTYVHRSTGVLTDENGQAQVTLYEEGYVLLNAFRMDTEGRYTVGPSVLVHVKPSTDPSTAKLRLREQLDEVYYDENYPESAFTAERWAERKAAYEEGVQGIANAATLGEASTAQSEAIAAIKKLQSDMDETNVNNPWNFRYQLSTLPDEVTKLDAAAQTTIDTLADLYEKIKATPYQLAELTEQ